jgi:hypothetical protein
MSRVDGARCPSIRNEGIPAPRIWAIARVTLLYALRIELIDAVLGGLFLSPSRVRTLHQGSCLVSVKFNALEVFFD